MADTMKSFQDQTHFSKDFKVDMKWDIIGEEMQVVPALQCDKLQKPIHWLQLAACFSSKHASASS